MDNSLDILKVHSDGTLLWVEAADNLEAAKDRVRELLATLPGEYYVFDQNSRRMVASLITRPEHESSYALPMQ